MTARYFKQLLIVWFLIGLVNLIAFSSPVLASDKAVNVYFFYSQTCPHCAQQKPLMEYIDQHNEAVKLILEAENRWRLSALPLSLLRQ